MKNGPGTAEQQEKPKLSRRNLEKVRVFYYANKFLGNRPGRIETVLDTVDRQEVVVTQIPANVERLRVKLLHYDRTVPTTSKYVNILKEELKLDPNTSQPPTSAWWKARTGEYTDLESRKANYEEDEISAAHNTADVFDRHYLESEAKWMDTLLEFLFKEHDKARPDEIWQRHKATYDQWHIAQSKPWTEAAKFGRKFKAKEPRPDLTYGFPILTPEQLGIGNIVDGMTASEDVANFMADFLQDILRRDNIITSPATGLRRTLIPGAPKMRRDEYLCFPWALVEAKRDGDKKTPSTMCYCQAANGVAAALALQESLKRKLGRDDDLYPVIAFTCVGSEIKTWLAYSEQDDGEPVTRMVCVEDADVRTTWGVYCMRLVVGNMLKWVSDDLRTKLAKHLAYVRRNGRYPPLPTTFPQTPVRTTFPDDCWSSSARVFEHRDKTKETRVVKTAKKASTSVAKPIKRPTPKPIHHHLEDLDLCDPEDESSLDSESQDSGIGGISDKNNDTDIGDETEDTNNDLKNDIDDGTHNGIDDADTQEHDDIDETTNDSDPEIDRIVRHEKRPSKSGQRRLMKYLVVYKGGCKPQSRWIWQITLTKDGYKYLIDEYWDNYWESLEK